MANTTIDFGADNGVDPGGGGSIPLRYYTMAMPPLPNGDWCIGFRFRQDHTWDLRDYVFQFRDAGDANSINLSMADDDSSMWPRDDNGDGPGGQLLPGGWTAGVDQLVVFQRRGANFEFYVVAEGVGSASPSFTSAHGFTAGFSAGGTLYLGSNIYEGSVFQNPFGEFFVLSGDSLSAANVVALAAGVHITAVKPTPLVDLRFRTSSATEPNLGTGGATYNATRVGTGWTTATEFFPDTPANALEAVATAQSSATGLVSSKSLVTNPLRDMDSDALKTGITYSNVHAYLSSNRSAIAASWTNKTTDVAGKLLLSNTSLTVGVSYDIVGWTADGSDRFHDTVVAANV